MKTACCYQLPNGTVPIVTLFLIQCSTSDLTKKDKIADLVLQCRRMVNYVTTKLSSQFISMTMPLLLLLSWFVLYLEVLWLLAVSGYLSSHLYWLVLLCKSWLFYLSTWLVRGPVLRLVGLHDNHIIFVLNFVFAALYWSNVLTLLSGSCCILAAKYWETCLF